MGIWIKTEILLGILKVFKELIIWMDQVDWLIAGCIFMVWIGIAVIILTIWGTDESTEQRRS